MIYGTNTVLEALRAGRVKALRVSDRAGGRIEEILVFALPENTGIAVKRVPPAELDRASRGGVHQGVVADLHERERATAAERSAWTGAREAALIVVLDGVEDPHNVGAILRSVDAAGADGLIRQERHAAPLDAARPPRHRRGPCRT